MLANEIERIKRYRYNVGYYFTRFIIEKGITPTNFAMSQKFKDTSSARENRSAR